MTLMVGIAVWGREAAGDRCTAERHERGAAALTKGSVEPEHNRHHGKAKATQRLHPVRNHDRYPVLLRRFDSSPTI